jgi:hypothetical protein
MHDTFLVAAHPAVAAPTKMDARQEQEYHEQANRWSVPP